MKNDGEQVRVVWAAQKFAPIQYHSFDVGPFEYVTTVQPGETLEQAHDRAFAFVKSCAKKAYREARDEFFACVADAGETASRRRR